MPVSQNITILNRAEENEIPIIVYKPDKLPFPLSVTIKAETEHFFTLLPRMKLWAFCTTELTLYNLRHLNVSQQTQLM